MLVDSIATVGDRLMRFVALPVLLALTGCLSFSSSNPPPPAPASTVVLPPGTQVVCANGALPPCR